MDEKREANVSEASYRLKEKDVERERLEMG